MPNPSQSFLTLESAKQAIDDAISLASGDLHLVAKTCADGFVEAFEQCYNADDSPAVFIVVGPGLTGLIGAYVALNLKKGGYEPAVYSAYPSNEHDITVFCDEHNIPLYDFVPSTLEFYFQVVVDALLGVGFDGGDIWQQYWSIFDMLVSTRVPIASVDVPSGWDLTMGPRPVDRSADTFVKPELLVSLGAPKLGSKMFAGNFHFIAGRHLPQEYFAEKGISVPIYPAERKSVLFSSGPFLGDRGNGAVYGKRGQFNATLYTKNEKREWVDVDDHMDLWDELD